MSQSGCSYDQDWGLFHLGVIEMERRAEMQRHLDAGCPQCLAAYQEWAALVPAIGLSTPERRPSPEVETLLEQRLRGSRKPPSRSLVQTAGWAGALAAMIAMVISLALQSRQYDRQLNTERQRMALLLEENGRLKKIHPEVATVTPVQPAPPPLPVPHRAERATEPLPLKPPAVTEDRLSSELALADLARTRDELSAKLADAERRAQLLEEKLRDAEQQNAALQTGRVEAANADRSKLEEQLSRLRADVRRSGYSRDDYRRLLAVLRSGPVKTVELRAIDPAVQGASAHALVNNHSEIFLLADRLPALPANKCYQLWLIRKANPSIVSGGILQVDANGAAVLTPFPVDSRSSLTGLAITDEPAGGSVSAKGHKLLFGAL